MMNMAFIESCAQSRAKELQTNGLTNPSNARYDSLETFLVRRGKTTGRITKDDECLYRELLREHLSEILEA